MTKSNAAGDARAIRIVPIPTHTDARGRLRVCEFGQALPFVPLRTFIISDVLAGATRAGHAVSCDLFMLAVCGACRLTASVGGVHTDYPLTSQLGGVLVPAETWILLSDFASGTALLVHAEHRHADARYRNSP